MAPFHYCPVAGCQRFVQSRQLMCGGHWRLVTHPTQTEVYLAWHHGKGAGTPRHAAACALAISEANAAVAMVR